jgi:hypothetical protein
MILKQVLNQCGHDHDLSKQQSLAATLRDPVFYMCLENNNVRTEVHCSLMLRKYGEICKYMPKN